MTKRKWVKLHKEFIDFDGPIGPIIDHLQKIYQDHPEAYIDTVLGYYDQYSEYVFWEVPMTPEEIEVEKKRLKKIRDEQKRKAARTDAERKKTLQELYKEFMGKELELK